MEATASSQKLSARAVVELVDRTGLESIVEKYKQVRGVGGIFMFRAISLMSVVFAVIGDDEWQRDTRQHD